MNYQDITNFYRGKKVLVTGHTGFKGTWLCKVLSMAGANVYGYALEPPTNPSIYNILKGDNWIKSNIGDIRDYDKLKKCIEVENPEYIFHLAAQPIVRKSYKIPKKTYETNVMGTVNILECIRELPGVKGFLNVTTDKVYDNEYADNHPFSEDEKLNGYDPYSNSKSCSELVTHSYKRSFFSCDNSVAVSTARAGNVIGGGDFSSDRIIPDCVKNTINGDFIDIRNVMSIRPYQHVLEPISVYLIIMMMQTASKDFEGYYNVGPDKEDCITTGELADMFVGFWGENSKWRVREQADAPHEAAYLRLDCSKLKSVFGWSPVWHISEAVKTTVEWYKTWNNNGDCSSETEKQILEYFRKYRFGD